VRGRAGHCRCGGARTGAVVRLQRGAGDRQRRSSAHRERSDSNGPDPRRPGCGSHYARKWRSGAGAGFGTSSLADWQFHPVASGENVAAAVGLARDDGMQPFGEDQFLLLGNLLDQVALALDRARLEREARESPALRERDRLRAALLASIGEDVNRGSTPSRQQPARCGAAARTTRRSFLRSPPRPRSSTAISKTCSILLLAPTESPRSWRLYDRSRPAIGEKERRARPPDTEGVCCPGGARQTCRARADPRLSAPRRLGPAQERHIDYLRVAVGSLRQKLERAPARPELIINEPAVGYRLSTP
jgi:hypothetical protein